MRRSLSRLGVLAIVVGSVACTGAGERVARTRSAFTSANAELVDFDFDGKLVSDTSDDARLRTLLGARLMASVGQLNADRANGRHERLELTAITATASDAAPDHFDVTYHAKLPVAWAGATKPTTYTLILPAKVAEADQIDFAAKYGATCTDEAAGPSPIEAW